MSSNKKLSESVPETLGDPSSGLISAVKEWVAGASGTDTEDLLRELNKTVIEQVLETELDHHLGYKKHDPAGDRSGNTRNGTRSKTVKTIVGSSVARTDEVLIVDFASRQN